MVCWPPVKQTDSPRSPRETLLTMYDLRNWLRCYEGNDEWAPTPQELADQERQRAEQAEKQVLQIVQNLAQAGISLEDIVAMTGLSPNQVQALLE